MDSDFSFSRACLKALVFSLIGYSIEAQVCHSKHQNIIKPIYMIGSLFDYSNPLTIAKLGALEFIYGSLWNRHYQLWDYRDVPHNLCGQTCLSAVLLFFVLGNFVNFFFERLIIRSV